MPSLLLPPFTFFSSVGLQFFCKHFTSVWINKRSATKMGHFATSQKVAGSSPDEVDFFFNFSDLSSRAMTLGSTQPITEMSPRNLPGA
jgi:hypothetical protein